MDFLNGIFKLIYYGVLLLIILLALSALFAVAMKIWGWLEDDGFIKGKALINYEKEIPEKYSYLEPTELETVYNCLVRVYNFKQSNKYAHITMDNVLYADMGISMTFTDVYERTGRSFEVKTSECKYMKLDLEYLKKLLNK